MATSGLNALNMCTTWTWDSNNANKGALSGTAFYCGIDMSAAGATIPAAGKNQCAADVTTTSFQVTATWFPLNGACTEVTGAFSSPVTSCAEGLEIILLRNFATDPVITSTKNMNYRASFAYKSTSGATAVTAASTSTISTNNAQILTVLGSVGMALLALSF